MWLLAWVQEMAFAAQGHGQGAQGPGAGQLPAEVASLGSPAPRRVGIGVPTE